MPDLIDSFRGAFRFLSNPFECPVRGPDLHLYPSVEYGFQALKTIDEDQRIWVASAPTWQEAKSRGQLVTLRPGWNEHVRYTVMEQLIAAKFDPVDQPEMATRLVATGDATLIEGNNWHDNVWGVCSCSRTTCQRWGINLLGWMLMRQRTRVKAYQ